MQFTEIRWMEIGFIASGLYALWYLYKAYRYAIETHEAAKKKTFNGLTELMRIEAEQDARNCRYRVQKQVAILGLVVSALFRPPVSFDMGIEGYSRLAAIIIFAYLQFKYIQGSRNDEADRKTKLEIAEHKWLEDERLRLRLRDAKKASDAEGVELRVKLDESTQSLQESVAKVEDVTAKLASSEAARESAIDAASTDRATVIKAQLDKPGEKAEEEEK